MNYRDRAEAHKPKIVEETRAAARRLLEEGYNDHGIAAALGLAVEQVRRMLGYQDCA